MRATAHREQAHLAPDLRLDQGPHQNVVAVADAVLRHEAEPHAGRHHGQNPVVAIAAVDAPHLGAVGEKDRARVLQHLAIGAVEIALPVELAHGNRVHARQPVIGIQRDDELLAEQRKRVQALVDALRQAIDGRLQVAGEQPLLQLGGACIHDLELDAGMALLQAADQPDEVRRPDRAHHAEAQPHVVELDEARRAFLGFPGLAIGLLEVGMHEPPQLGQMGARALTMEQRPAQLLLQELDGSGQGRLGDVAGLRRTGEIELLADRQKIANLLHFHGVSLRPPHPPETSPYPPRMKTKAEVYWPRADLPWSCEAASTPQQPGEPAMSRLSLVPATQATRGPASQMAGHLAHDLRNVLTTVGLHLETLERLAGAHGAKPASAGHALLAKAAALCNALLASESEAESRRTAVDMAQVARDVVALLKPTAPDGFAVDIAAGVSV